MLTILELHDNPGLYFLSMKWSFFAFWAPIETMIIQIVIGDYFSSGQKGLYILISKSKMRDLLTVRYAGGLSLAERRWEPTSKRYCFPAEQAFIHLY